MICYAFMYALYAFYCPQNLLRIAATFALRIDFRTRVVQPDLLLGSDELQYAAFKSLHS